MEVLNDFSEVFELIKAAMTRLSGLERTWSSLELDRSQSTPIGFNSQSPAGTLDFLAKSTVYGFPSLVFHGGGGGGGCGDGSGGRDGVTVVVVVLLVFCRTHY
ncbi:hypothetical protein Fot_23585 [Forsythia ovata]|uniref:Uncharacterized protein n=1 Tax=Forsythia ovata TaxID=205694 RepID=A0ABD1V0Y8_9LAMI